MVKTFDVFDSPEHNYNSWATKRIGWPDLCHSKPLAKFKQNPKRNVACRLNTGNLCGQKNEAKNIPRQDFMVMNISCKFEKSTYNTLSSRGVARKSLHTAAEVAYSCVVTSIVSTGCYPVETIIPSYGK